MAINGINNPLADLASSEAANAAAGSRNALAGNNSGAPSGEVTVSNPAAVTQSTGTQATPQSTPEESIDRKALEELAAQISDQIQIQRRSLSFSVDDNIGRTVVTVTDLESDEVIRQIPSEEVIRLAQTIRDLNEQLSDSGNALDVSGLLISDQA